MQRLGRGRQWVFEIKVSSPRKRDLLGAVVSVGGDGRMMLIIDDFLPNIEQVRASGLSAPYIDWEGYDGQTYKRVCLTDILA